MTVGVENYGHCRRDNKDQMIRPYELLHRPTTENYLFDIQSSSYNVKKRFGVAFGFNLDIGNSLVWA
jgi:hypothetical protein